MVYSLSVIYTIKNIRYCFYSLIQNRVLSVILDCGGHAYPNGMCCRLETANGV